MNSRQPKYTPRLLLHILIRFNIGLLCPTKKNIFFNFIMAIDRWSRRSLQFLLFRIHSGVTAWSLSSCWAPWCCLCCLYSTIMLRFRWQSLKHIFSRKLQNKSINFFFTFSKKPFFKFIKFAAIYERQQRRGLAHSHDHQTSGWHPARALHMRHMSHSWQLHFHLDNHTRRRVDGLVSLL